LRLLLNFSATRDARTAARSEATRILVECLTTPDAQNSVRTRRAKCQVPFRLVKKSGMRAHVLDVLLDEMLAGQTKESFWGMERVKRSYSNLLFDFSLLTQLLRSLASFSCWTLCWTFYWTRRFSWTRFSASWQRSCADERHKSTQ